MKRMNSNSITALGVFAMLAACNVDTSSAPAGDPGGAPARPPSAQAGAAPASSPPPSPGKALVRVVPASADAPAVDVYAKGGGLPLVTGLSYGQTSMWLEVPP